MGMFDNITYEAPCPICGTVLTAWQSKSGGCALEHLTLGELWEQRYDDEAAIVPDRIVFYQDCGKCGTWVEVSLSPGLLELTEDEYAKLRSRTPFERRRGPVVPSHDRAMRQRHNENREQ